MITEKIAVRINNKDEGHIVIDHYVKKYGWHTSGLTYGNCMKFPFLFLNAKSDSKLLSGHVGPPFSNFDLVVSYEEWCEQELGDVIEKPSDFALLFSMK